MNLFLNISDSNKYNNENGNDGKVGGQAPVKQESTTSENLVKQIRILSTSISS